MISQGLGKSQRTWDEQLPEIAFAYKPARHDATGYSPAHINTRRELTPPGSLQQENRQKVKTPWTTWLKHLQDAQELARVRLAQEFQRQQRHYNLRRRDWQPKIGERVWKRTHTLSNKAQSRNAKLAERYTGPFRVHKRISPVIFDLSDNRGRRADHVHVRDMKPVTGARTAQPRSVGSLPRNQDAQPADVTSIHHNGPASPAIKGRQHQPRNQIHDGSQTSQRPRNRSSTPPPSLKRTGQGRAAKHDQQGLEKVRPSHKAETSSGGPTGPSPGQEADTVQQGPDSSEVTTRRRTNSRQTDTSPAGTRGPASKTKADARGKQAGNSPGQDTGGSGRKGSRDSRRRGLTATKPPTRTATGATTNHSPTGRGIVPPATTTGTADRGNIRDRLRSRTSRGQYVHPLSPPRRDVDSPVQAHPTSPLPERREAMDGITGPLRERDLVHVHRGIGLPYGQRLRADLCRDKWSEQSVKKEEK
ncbi:zinc finger CCCH domain-containing protein 18-like [Osmia bicornis bicornis]|uniref:zinc finger CCCH domain-containing protein 18-like n=1 Tax=Osmia bicornis bicornis TaxID=1437191 RepID=UPI001EAEA85F|nr:zinc finger CCCH domain-containing protein 18-like [Osmia bicornis bicornis]